MNSIKIISTSIFRSLNNCFFLITYILNKFVNYINNPSHIIYYSFECPICLEDLNIHCIATLNCKHQFCYICIHKLLHYYNKNTTSKFCPICRKHITNITY